MTRIAGTISPSFMNGINWWTKLLHSTQYGVKLISGVWDNIDKEARNDAKYDRECLEGFEKLSPHSP
jgi:dimethylaniline monooxygenase (N-oxide forming)